MVESLILKGVMKGHTDQATTITTSIDNTDKTILSSRDKSILIWTVTKEGCAVVDSEKESTYSVPRHLLTDHSHFVQDVVLSSDG